MFLESLQKIKLYELLFLIDCDLSRQFKSKACPYCGKALHVANYLRKPRGGPDDLPEAFLIRHSFCCSSESCRKRALPPSCRFWGRKVYFRVFMLIVITLKQGRIRGFTAKKLQKTFNISKKTLKRWLIYFKQVFPFSRLWRKIRGDIAVFLFSAEIPGSLVHFFIRQSGNLQIGLIHSALFFSGGMRMDD